ncbi:MAG: hypothetical protein OXQ92_09015, partial [Boseongicola sp.]|nr:hypothetical protein [Boseongicola sp.]
MICLSKNGDTQLPWRWRDSRLGIKLLSAWAALFLIGSSQTIVAQADPILFERIEEISLPTLPGAHEPSLTSHDGTLYMSWMQHDEG